MDEGLIRRRVRDRLEKEWPYRVDFLTIANAVREADRSTPIVRDRDRPARLARRLAIIRAVLARLMV